MIDRLQEGAQFDPEDYNVWITSFNPNGRMERGLSFDLPVQLITEPSAYELNAGIRSEMEDRDLTPKARPLIDSIRGIPGIINTDFYQRSIDLELDDVVDPNAVKAEVSRQVIAHFDLKP